MPQRTWKKAQSIGHATTRLIHIPADLVREVLGEDVNSETIIGGKWSIGLRSGGGKDLVLELKRFEKWPSNE